MLFSSLKILVFCLLILLLGCGKKSPLPHELSFYYWKSKWALSPKETQTLQQLKVKKLYVKFFDIKWDLASGKILPVAQLQADSTCRTEHREIVPCVFIENQVFQHLDTTEIPGFAHVVAHKLNQKSAQFPKAGIGEVQIDCDWSQSTRASYFSFLQCLKTLWGKEISSTIRLHQIKYRRVTGVPPVTKGILMCYNLGALQDVKENNSIFNLPLLKDYTQRIDEYPLKLDIALPIYEWTVVFRNQRFVYVLNAPQTMLDTLQLQQGEGNRFTSLTSTRIGERTLLKGDLLRRESVADEELAETVTWFDEKLKNYTIVFYHLKEQNLVSHEGVFRVIPTF